MDSHISSQRNKQKDSLRTKNKPEKIRKIKEGDTNKLEIQRVSTTVNPGTRARHSAKAPTSPLAPRPSGRSPPRSKRRRRQRDEVEEKKEP